MTSWQEQGQLREAVRHERYIRSELHCVMLASINQGRILPGTDALRPRHHDHNTFTSMDFGFRTKRVCVVLGVGESAPFKTAYSKPHDYWAN